MDREATAISRRPDRDRRSGGFTLVEAMIVVGIIGIIAATAVPNVSRYMEAGRGRAAARSVADAFNIARAQAIRTGSNQIVFFGIDGAGDVAGNPLQHDGGQLVPILVLNDGPPGSADQNCEIDDGEEVITFDAQEGVGWGRNKPGVADEAPDDWRLVIPALGSSFRHPDHHRRPDLGAVPTGRCAGRDRCFLQPRSSRNGQRHDLFVDGKTATSRSRSPLLGVCACIRGTTGRGNGRCESNPS